MEIKLKLYGSSKILSDKDTLNIQLPNNSNIEKEDQRTSRFNKGDKVDCMLLDLDLIKKKSIFIN